MLERLSATALSGIRIAVPACKIGKACQPDIGDVLHGALAELDTAGAHLVEIDGRLLDDAGSLYMRGGIGGTECRAFLERELPGWLETLHPIVGSRLANATSEEDPSYHEVIGEQRRMAASAHTLFEHADVLALPGNLITPPPVAELADLERYLKVNGRTLRPTCPANLLELCAVTIPIGLDSSGMPVGLQLVARGGDDEGLLGVALAAERVLGTCVDRLGQPPALSRT